MRDGIPSQPSRPSLLPGLILLAAVLAGCACTTGSRHVEVTSAVAYLDEDGGEFGTFNFLVSEFRGTHAPGGTSVIWHYFTDTDPESVVVVQVWEGPGPLGGRLLYELPTWDDPPWVPVTLAPKTYPGPLSFQEFYGIMLAGNAHVEFTLLGGSEPTASGPLSVTRSISWHDTPCD